jgi:hypothetical protein
VTDAELARRLSPPGESEGKVLHVPCERAALGGLFARIQKERLPVQVDGNCLYGVNRTAGGYLIWIFNNDGVEKYCDEPERFDMSKTTAATVTCRGRTTETKIPPGGIKLLEWSESSASFREISFSTDFY